MVRLQKGLRLLCVVRQLKRGEVTEAMKHLDMQPLDHKRLKWCSCKSDRSTVATLSRGGCLGQDVCEAFS